MLFPKKLKDNDTVLLTSFSSTSVLPSELEDKIKRFETETQLKIYLDKTLLGTKTRHENLAKYREKMTNCINNLDLHEISALLSIRGGWSITDILLNSKVEIDSLIKKIIQRRAIVLGYSDNTLLGDYINLAYGYVTYHSPNFEGLYTWSEKSQELFMNCLKGSEIEVKLPLKKVSKTRSDKITGILISSNLECLTLSLAFTDKIHKEFKEKGLILLLEDIELEPSLAFRYLEVLLMRFKNEEIQVKAIIFGRFPNCIEHTYYSWENKTFKELLPHLVQYLEIPIYETDKVGHTNSEVDEHLDPTRPVSVEDEMPQPQMNDNIAKTTVGPEDHYTTPSGSEVVIDDGHLLYKL